MAIPDLRGDAQAQPLMGAFNETLWGDVQGSGLFRMVPKTMYPKANPQQASDWRQQPPARLRRHRAAGRRSHRPAPERRRLLDRRIGPARRSRPTTWPSATPPCRTACWCSTAGCTTWAAGRAGDRQALSGADRGRGRGAPGGAPIRRRHHRAVRRPVPVRYPHLFHLRPHRPQGNLVDGPGWRNQKQITNFKSITIQPAVSPDGTQDRIH